MKISVLGLVLVPAAALVSSAFAGTVKTHVESMKASGQPEVISVDKGEYTCSSCQPAIKIKADGDKQKVAGNSEYDAMMVRVLDPHSIEIVQELNGKNRAFYRYSVSPDGKTLTVKYNDYSTGTEKQGGYTATRLAAAPPGAHAVSGSWKIEQTSAEKPASAASAH